MFLSISGQFLVILLNSWCNKIFGGFSFVNRSIFRYGNQMVFCVSWPERALWEALWRKKRWIQMFLQAVHSSKKGTRKKQAVHSFAPLQFQKFMKCLSNYLMLLSWQFRRNWDVFSIKFVVFRTYFYENLLEFHEMSRNFVSICNLLQFSLLHQENSLHRM